MKVHLHSRCVHNSSYSITLQVLNQLRNDDHYTRQFEVEIRNYSNYTQVFSSDPYDYISFDELYCRDRNIQYVVNDSIKLRMWVRVMTGSEYRHSI